MKKISCFCFIFGIVLFLVALLTLTNSGGIEFGKTTDEKAVEKAAVDAAKESGRIPKNAIVHDVVDIGPSTSYEQKSIAAKMDNFIIIGGFLSSIISFAAGFLFLHQNSKSIIKRNAKILEKKDSIIMLEFDDGTRETFATLGNVNIVAGDVGIAEMQGDYLINFIHR